MTKGVIFSIGLVLITIGFLSGLLLVVMTKEGKFAQKAIGEYSYQMIDKFYDIEIARQSLIQSGRFALLAAEKSSLEQGIREACPMENGVAVWSGETDCFPTKDDFEKSITVKVGTLLQKYQKSMLYLDDNYELIVNVQPSHIVLTARPYSLVTYEVDKPSQKGEPYLASSESLSEKITTEKITACPFPQRLLAQKYLAAFSRYQTSIFAASKRFSVDPALLAALITEETSFGTNPEADRTDDYGRPMKDGIPDYLAGCRVCYIEGCLDHSTVSDLTKSNWRAPPNKPDHNIMCAAERIAAYKSKIASGEAFGCLMDSRYDGQSENMLIRKLACTYNSGPEKYSYAEEVYSFFLQWKDVLCKQNLLTGGVVTNPAPAQRNAIYSAMPAFSSEINVNMTEIETVISKAKELAVLCKTNSILCLQKSPFLDASCTAKYKTLPKIEPGKSLVLTFCSPITAPLLNDKPFYLKFSFLLPQRH